MHKKAKKGWLKHFDFIILDMISLEISFLLAFFIRHQELSLQLFRWSYSRMVLVLLMIDFVTIMLLRTFSGVLRRGMYEELIITAKQSVAVTLLSSFYLFTIQAWFLYSRATLILTAIIYCIFSYIVRLGWKKHLTSRPPNNSRSMILVANSEEAPYIIKKFNDNNYENVGITGIVILDKSMIGETINDIRVVADEETFDDILREGWVDEVFFGIDVNRKMRKKMQETLLEMGITAHQALWELSTPDETVGERNIERVGGYTVITRSIKILTNLEMAMKRILDILGAIVGLIFTGLLVVIIGPIIYIQSPGPIFFAQDRVGKNGKIFKLYKFRSMYPDAESRLKDLKSENKMNNDLMFKMDWDPRIIGSEKGPGKGIGNFIRKTSIDEFPQFWNVLIGEMSLVGTRPPLISEWEKYENFHRARMSTKPGITGMWQVSGRSNITNFDEVVRLDMEYIENWSFKLDIKIILKTVLQIFKHEGAA